jgi:hypothetical protein
MITPQPPGVKQRSGPLPAQKFSVRVDERAGITGITRRFPFRNTIAGDTMNRWYTPGVVPRGNKGTEVAG